MSAYIEDDAKKLAQAIMAGEFDTQGLALTEVFSDQNALLIARGILEFIIENRMFTLRLLSLNTKKWLSREDLEIYLDLGRKSIEKHLAEGSFYGTKALGGHWRIDRDDVDRFMNGDRRTLIEMAMDEAINK